VTMSLFQERGKILQYLSRERQHLWKSWSESENFSQPDKGNSEFLIKKHWISVIKTNWKSYHWLYCIVIKTVKAQLTNWSVSILSLNLISLIDIRKSYSTVKSFQLLLMNCLETIVYLWYLIVFFWKLNFPLFISWKNFCKVIFRTSSNMWSVQIWV
jgi:hypothetical protein